MHLFEFLAKTGVTKTEFAKAFKLCAQTIWRLNDPRFGLSKRLAREISEATDGLVTMESLVFPEEEKYYDEELLKVWEKIRTREHPSVIKSLERRKKLKEDS